MRNNYRQGPNEGAWVVTRGIIPPVELVRYAQLANFAIPRFPDRRGNDMNGRVNSVSLLLDVSDHWTVNDECCGTFSIRLSTNRDM